MQYVNVIYRSLSWLAVFWILGIHVASVDRSPENMLCFLFYTSLAYHIKLICFSEELIFETGKSRLKLVRYFWTSKILELVSSSSVYWTSILPQPNWTVLTMSDFPLFHSCDTKYRLFERFQFRKAMNLISVSKLFLQEKNDSIILKFFSFIRIIVAYMHYISLDSRLI